MLVKQKPDYTHLRVFGSGCYPCLRPITEHKFEPRSLLCVFLGYSSQYKGYRCLYPPTGRVYISRHVIFDESVFPFKDQYKNLVPRYETGLLKAWQLATAQPEEPPVPEKISWSLPKPVITPHTPFPPQAPAVDHGGEEAQPPAPVVEEQASTNTHSMITRAKA